MLSKCCQSRSNCPQSAAEIRCKSGKEAWEKVRLHGFAILESGFSSEYLENFHQHLLCLDLHEEQHHRQPYDNTHFSFNDHPLLDVEMYEKIFTCDGLREALDLLAPQWWIGKCGGDKVNAGSKSHQ